MVPRLRLASPTQRLDRFGARIGAGIRFDYFGGRRSGTDHAPSKARSVAPVRPYPGHVEHAGEGRDQRPPDRIDVDEALDDNGADERGRMIEACQGGIARPVRQHADRRAAPPHSSS